MDNFNFHAYTEMLFGKGEIKNLPEALSRHGKNVLLVYGGGSIKKNGIYDSIQNLLKDFTNMLPDRIIIRPILLVIPKRLMK